MAEKERESKNKAGPVPEHLRLKKIARMRRYSVTELYDNIKEWLVDPRDGQLMSFEAFRGRFNRGNEPDWLVNAVENGLKSAVEFGQRLIPAGFGKLQVIGGVGAGGHPSNNMDENEMVVPIEFAEPTWRGMIVESDSRSMMPYVQPGDTVVIKPTRTPMLKKFMVIQSDTDPNTMYVKKVDYRNDGFVLVNTNPESAPLDMQGLSVVGIVVGLISADMKVRIGPYEPGLSEEYMISQLRSRLP